MATRHGQAGPAEASSRERLLQAALTVLVEQGVAGLTVRGLAGAAGSSTIGVYTRFGGRTGVLDALYERTFELLHEELVKLPPVSGDPLPDVLAFARAYREFALESPARYAFMFERAVPGYDPDPDLRMLAQRNSYDLLVERVRPAAGPVLDTDSASYLVWTTMHGLVSLELTHRARTPPPGWFLKPGDDSYGHIFQEGILTALAGLAARQDPPGRLFGR
ncbi:AcrR family transcriptional regulator [Amycolatopsis bartoniae]|uniref:TetR family transcriptional regulator n=1 Tax=Amycolatopsis bartoniae TaxID=941986 RepID=A0A8H9IUW6_9PSEU|nr:TetR/AcrR family transcriptional regulator [Amycolatopsis bartoniae]MBB2936889.1 AcrR family transcriptional regulator [Amycolatopsis bartoniae]TVT07260.1 TetR/AcrR family transcriptional regulator [Amycolatopsis bartoniae]GHF50949.1 TetR family transcriptional regulator [Amycolatopsis bartoniae]